MSIPANHLCIKGTKGGQGQTLGGHPLLYLTLKSQYHRSLQIGACHPNNLRTIQAQCFLFQPFGVFFNKISLSTVSNAL